MGLREETTRFDGSSHYVSHEVEHLQQLADQCVKCGYCVTQCPTYLLKQQEGESPRGRIALVQGWLYQHIHASEQFRAHLTSCLQCRACEPSCPSLVQFGQLIDGSRARLARDKPLWKTRIERVILQALSNPHMFAVARFAGILYRRLGLGRWLSRGRGGIGGVVSAFDWIFGHGAIAGNKRLRQATTDRRGPDPNLKETPVAVFLGCVSRSAHPSIADASINVLSRLGYPAIALAGQVCCGAMLRHNGYPKDADRLSETNVAVFGNHTVVGFASACVAELSEHSTVDAIEVCRFLTERPWPPSARLMRTDVTIAVHEPCTHRNVLREQAFVYRLLERIPGASILPLPGNDLCCGAAGAYLVSQNHIARELVRPKIEALRRFAPDIVVTTNTGCALHLAAGIRRQNLSIEVLHPVELIERLLL